MRLTSSPKLVRIADGPSGGRSRQGAVLLEVVLALALFVAAATVLTGGLNSSLEAVERLRYNTHAANLAVTVMSELQMGVRSAVQDGAQPFEPPLERWSWEVVTMPVEIDSFDENSGSGGPYHRVEVVIRRDEPRLVYRLTQVLQIDAQGVGDDSDSSF